MLKINLCIIYKAFLCFIIAVVTTLSHAETLLDFHQRQCQAGIISSCERALSLQAGEEEAKQIELLAKKFVASVSTEAFNDEGTPNLAAIYQPILQHYLAAKYSDGFNQDQSKQAEFIAKLSVCSKHYHNHWRNRKMWWPQNEQGQPNWTEIYYYVIDHYYGYCLRKYP